MDDDRNVRGGMDDFSGGDFFRELVERASDAIIVHDTVRILYANQSALDIFGAGSMADLMDREIWSLLHPDDRDILRLRCRELFAGETDSPFHSHERKIIALDGREIHVDGTASVITTGGRRLVAVHLRNASQRVSARERQQRAQEDLEREVTLRTAETNRAAEELWQEVQTRRETERLLKETEERFRAIFELVNLPMTLSDMEDGCFVEVNSEFCRIMGLSRERIIGRTLLELQLFQDVGKIGEVLQVLERDGRFTGVVRVRTPSGVRDFLEWVRVLDMNGRRFLLAAAIDVTDSRRAEEALRKSEDRFRTLLGNAPIPMSLSTMDGVMVEVNDEFSAVTGYTREEVLGRTPVEVGLSGDTERFQQLLDVFAREGKFEGEPTYTMKNGTSRSFVGRGTVLRLNGVPHILVGMMDITERRGMEERLRESEERFRTLAEELPAMVFINQGGSVVYANHKSVTSMGYTTEEFTAPGFDFMSVIAPESREAVRVNFARHSRGQDVAPYDYRLLTRDGQYLDAIIHTRLISYGGRPAILGIVTDISELKKAQRAVLQSEENLRRIVEASPLGILVHEDGVFVTANPASVALLRGRSELDILGRTVWSFVAPDFVPLVHDRYKDLHQGPRSLKAAEYRIVLLDGTITDVEMISQSFPVGDRLRVLTIMRDISDRKAAEQAMIIAREVLERQNEELRRLDRIRETIIRDVSHELKTPIAKQQMQLQLLKRLVGSWDRAAECETVIRIMRESLGRQEAAIRNILDLAQIESGGRQYRHEPVSLADSLREVLAEFQQIFLVQRVKLGTAIEEVEVVSDRQMLWHVFSNLISNAVKFRRDTGARVDIGVTVRGGEAVISFADNGIGLSPEALERIFDRFYKANPASEGSGIGLSLVKKVVEDLGGRINVTSEGERRGTTVTVTLPLRGRTA